MQLQLRQIAIVSNVVSKSSTQFCVLKRRIQYDALTIFTMKKKKNTK